MNCAEIHTLFTDYADNSLDRQELLLFTGHLGECATCAAAWREYQTTVQLVRGLEPVPPPADLLPGIQEKLGGQGAWERFLLLFKKLNISLSLPAAATAFAIAMLAGFLVKNSPIELPTHQSDRAITALRPFQPLSRERTLAVVHTDRRPYHPTTPLGYQDGLHPATTVLATHLAAHQNARRLLSPDLGVLLAGVSEQNRLRLLATMRQHEWQVHQMGQGILLVHLPPGDLEHFQALMGQHRSVINPADPNQLRPGREKKMLTAAIRFQ